MNEQNFYIKFNGDTVDMEFEKWDISGKYSLSPNRNIFIVCDTLYSGESSKESVVVFTKDKILYKKAIPNDEAAEDYYVFDDASAIVLIDENLLKIDSEGKISKKKIPSIDKHGIINDIIWIIGNNDNGETVLFFYNIETAKSICKVIPEIEAVTDNEGTTYEVIASVFTGDSFVFLYENESDVVAYNLTGEQCEPTNEEKNAVLEELKNKKERERQYRIEKYTSSLDYWRKRLANSIKEKKPDEEITRAKNEIQNYRNKLIQMGIVLADEIPFENTILKNEKKKGFFSRLFNK